MAGSDPMTPEDMKVLTTQRKKLIEVALPLDAINEASAREKSIRHGHPSTIHIWWARRPLAACRAVIFASLVDDPSSRPDLFPTEEVQDKERVRLFSVIEKLVQWDTREWPALWAEVRREISAAVGDREVVLHDPFCGGGSIPLEGRRLGLKAFGSDLNPVASLVTRSLIDFPARFCDQSPVQRQDGSLALDASTGSRGLAADVRYYGKWLRDEAERRIGHLFPKVKLENGREGVVNFWIWARTVRSPNPAWPSNVPLIGNFSLSTKPGQEWSVSPTVDRTKQGIEFEVHSGLPMNGPTVARAGATCLATGVAIPFEYIREQAQAGRLGVQLMAMVVQTPDGRRYMSPTAEQKDSSTMAIPPEDVPMAELPDKALGFRVQAYGVTKYRQLFSDRQLLVMCTFSDLVQEVRELVLRDALSAGLAPGDSERGAAAYADVVATYLAFAVDKLADRNSTLATWAPNRQHPRNAFTRQAISMTWDFTEVNPFAESSGNFFGGVESIAQVLDELPAGPAGYVSQLSATAPLDGNFLYSTDPPYYDNVGYAALSDYFYIWLRRSLAGVFPDLFSTLLVPKTDELIADPARHAGKRRDADKHFESGMEVAFAQARASMDPDFPLTVYYAFKQSESSEAGDTSTGWETMLQGLLQAGFSIGGTWPLRTELGRRMRGQASNALASSIVLVCRPRPDAAPLATRKEFLAALRAELPDALRKLQQGNIAPVDLAQSAIGPGMGVFSRYSKVVEADGSPMRVRVALGLINEMLDQTLAEQEADFDADTRWALAWFEENGMSPGPFGMAETLSKAKNTAVNALVGSGIVESKAGKVRLLDRVELDSGWDPATDSRLTVWEVTQHLIQTLLSSGEEQAAALLRRVGGLGETGRELAYRLYVLCDRKKWASEALAYNSLVVAWPEISRLAAIEPSGMTKSRLFEPEGGGA